MVRSRSKADANSPCPSNFAGFFCLVLGVAGTGGDQFGSCLARGALVESRSFGGAAGAGRRNGWPPGTADVINPLPCPERSRHNVQLTPSPTSYTIRSSVHWLLGQPGTEKGIYRVQAPPTGPSLFDL